MSYFHLLGGQLYTFDEITDWLMKSGFDGVRRINLLRAPGSSLVIGTKSGS